MTVAIGRECRRSPCYTRLLYTERYHWRPRMLALVT